MKKVGLLTYSPLTKDKKKILEKLMGSASSKQIDFNKVRDEYKCDFSLGQLTSMIRCSNCSFTIYVYPNQSKAICEHCNTINDLRLNTLL